MKYYTVKEVATKLRVSESHVYELVKRGELKKKEGLGKIVRIPANEIKTLENQSYNLNYNKDKIQVIETHLGNIRKVKGEDEYILKDVAEALMIAKTSTIKTAVNKSKFKKIDSKEAKELGLTSIGVGLLFVNYAGIVEYLEEKSLNLNNLDFKRFLKELKVNDYEQVKFKEVEDKSIKLINMFEGRNVEIILVNEQPLFELYSVGEALGQIKISKGKVYPRKERIEANLKNADIKPVVHNGQQYLTEEMLYDFMLEAKTEKCKSFRKWVTNEVLPTIRKTGGYVDNTNKFTDFYFSNLSLEVRQAIKQELVNRNNEILIKTKQVEIEFNKLKNEYEINNKAIEELTLINC